MRVAEKKKAKKKVAKKKTTRKKAASKNRSAKSAVSDDLGAGESSPETPDPDSVRPSGLTQKQALFIQEYLLDLNATQAAIRAGYSEDSAYSIGNENLKKPEIRQAIQKAMDLRVQRTQITADRIMVELARIGFGDVRQLFTEAGKLRDISTLPEEVAAAIQSVEVVTRNAGKNPDGTTDIEHVHKIRFADKKAALELLGKNIKLFTDKLELTGKDGQPIKTHNVTAELSAKEAAQLYKEFIRGG